MAPNPPSTSVRGSVRQFQVEDQPKPGRDGLGLPKKLSNKHVRCNPDVAPRLTSGVYEDKVDVITPINILLIGGGEF